LKKTLLIGISVVALFLCSVAAFAAPPVSEAQSLDQLRQQIFSPASAPKSASADVPAVGAPAPRLLADDPCEEFGDHPCLYWICTCNMVICAGCGAQTVICPNPGPTTCICNPPC
jgi:hypothetical protein